MTDAPGPRSIALVSVHAMLLVGAAGMLVVIAIWFALLARLRADERRLSSFSLVSTLIACGLLATAQIVSGSSPTFVAMARSWQLASMGAIAALVPDLFAGLVGVRLPRWPSITAGALFATLAASGLFVDPRDGEDPARLGVAGIVAAALLALAMTPMTLQFARATLERRELRLLALGLALVLASGIVDIVSWARGVRQLEVTIHTISLTILLLAATLMRQVFEAEGELERSSTLLARSLEDLARAEHELDETRRRAAIGELAAVVAHEVRNPLAVLRNAASSLRKRTTRPRDVAMLLAIVREETHRLGDLGQSLAHFAEPMSFRPTIVRVGPLIDDVVAAIRRAHESDVPFTFTVTAGDLHLHADAALLRRALVNVIDNAVRAMPSGGHIAITVTATERALLVDVLDEGEGMSAAVRERAKDPFFTTRATGTGLGLALVEKVIQMHGGEVTLHPVEPHGTRVTMALPRWTDDDGRARVEAATLLHGA